MLLYTTLHGQVLCSAHLSASECMFISHLEITSHCDFLIFFHNTNRLAYLHFTTVTANYAVWSIDNDFIGMAATPSVLWRCWLGGRKGIRPVKKLGQWVVGVVMSGARRRLHIAQLMPLPLTVSCFSKIQIGFTFLVLAHPGRPGKGPLNGCVCVVWQPIGWISYKQSTL